MASRRFTFLAVWHGVLGLQRQKPHSWHFDRLREEEQELREAQAYLEKISEASDVIFSISRAQHDGFNIQPLPSFFDRKYMLAYPYMFGKFSSRWLFYITASLLCRAPHIVREVVNPTKNEKLLQVATRHQIDPVRFTRALVDRTLVGDKSGKTGNFWHFLPTGFDSISHDLSTPRSSLWRDTHIPLRYG
ncbi:conserved hypothetical protein [Talaromyces stipitatus ATCC 10500]|uniref:Uncharacterized protein n=1 Tax=Talaromyces stipitatus (strain ATCC 10500 / CBS 375.48 / QM 6759 / NRRL 1006) TaxID=441959 RepID=B8MAW9_TALSN|nr:uncharacterized protein TSTA_123980 [Talaromyces stipitatus ATCC 10500]EED18670.1 conserved hypothetical protein [Talaromyces stipitatus ATCC 10500]